MSKNMAVNPALSTSWGQTVASERTVPPTHWDSTWSRMVVYRAGLTDSKGREYPRKPLFAHADKIKGSTPSAERDRAWSNDWWAGVGLTHDQCLDIVSDELTEMDRQSIRVGAYGAHPNAAKDIAHMPWHDDHVVIDCDVKTYYDSPDGQAWIHAPEEHGSKQWVAANSYTRHGLEDLYREAEKWGMVREELDDCLDTWTEGTKSGGQHIVLKQHDEVRIDRSMHHRHEYRVDVLANNWRACYPTPGYVVLKDRPVKQISRRLAELLIELNRDLDPVGGKRMARLESAAKVLHRRVYTRGGTVRPEVLQDTSLMDRWRLGVLRVVHEADQLGGWNNRIFWTACRYAEGGWAQTDAERDIIAAARPWGPREERQALDSINSAYNNVARKGATR